MALGALIVLRTIMVSSARDAERASHRRTAHRFRSLVEHSSDITCIVDERGYVTYVSPSVEQVLGARPAQVEHTTWHSHVHLSDVPEVRAACEWARTDATGVARVPLRLRRRGGGWQWFELLLTDRVRDPLISGLVGNLRNVDDHRRSRDRLQREALHDALTGLPNRVLLLQRLEAVLKRSGHNSVAVAFFDLDRFKEINDTLGHEVGDELLRTVAARVRQAVRPGDIVARFGGDELVIVCEQLSGRGAALEIVQRAKDSVSQDLTVNGHELRVTPSIGVSFSSGPDDDPQGMIRDADAAMYLAKDRGRGRIEVFDSTMREAALQRLETGNGLHRALTAEQFRVHYQPIVRAKTGEIVSLEALVRWQHPERGLIAPGHFIDRADELGVTAPIGEFVLDTACAALRTWRDRDEGRRQLSVGQHLGAPAPAGPLRPHGRADAGPPRSGTVAALSGGDGERHARAR
ncbi:MAG: putative bifunctional diguanylate cyclase/phosphodiesterase [Egibacteraceae bacterium]